MNTFALPLANAQLPAMSAGELEINYNEKLESVYWRQDSCGKWLLVPLMMLNSEMFAGVLMEINNAIENNKSPL